MHTNVPASHTATAQDSLGTSAHTVASTLKRKQKKSDQTATRTNRKRTSQARDARCLSD